MGSISRRVFLASGTLCQGLRLFGQEGPSPIVEVDKPVFARGEVIRVWVGVRASSPIAPEKQQPGVLHIVRPDGIHEQQLVSPPIDGAVNRGWKGGASLGKAPVLLGQYRLWFEWNQKKSPEVELTVREWDLRDRIVARWVIRGDDFRHAVAILEVENQTDQTVRFAKLGISGSEVWLSCVQEGPHPSGISLFYPWKELLPEEEEFPGADAYEAGWKDLESLPVVKVEPHRQFSQTLALAKVDLGFPVTNPRIAIGTELTVFVGGIDDPMAGLYPVRLAVRGDASF